MKISLWFALVLALSVTGCTKAVTIIEPAPGKPITAPLTEFRVQFSTWFNPGTFRAELDGDDVTAQFSPIAAKGGTSLMRMPDTFDGFKFGTWIPTSSPQPPPPVGALPSDIHFTPRVGPPMLPPPTGTGKPAPNIAMYTHLLHVTASCWGLICSVSDDLVFFPPHIVGLPRDLNVRIGIPEQARVEIYPALSTDVKVRITPTTGSVRLDNELPGVSITTTVPAGGQSRLFSITGVVSSNMVLFIEGRGLQRGAISGVVNP